MIVDDIRIGADALEVPNVFAIHVIQKAFF